MTPAAYRDACLKLIGAERDKVCELMLGVSEGENADGSPNVVLRSGAKDFAEYKGLISSVQAYTIARRIMLEQYRMLFEQPQPGGTEGDGVIERTSTDPVY